MLKILIPSMLLFILVWLLPMTFLWTTTIIYSFLVALVSLETLLHYAGLVLAYLYYHSKVDLYSIPLLVLTCWLLPLIILASKKHISTKPPLQQRLHLALMVALQVFLILSFSVTNLMMFFLAFEAILVPTLIIVTCWGSQKNRLAAGTYFLFFTMAGSLPLLIALTYVYHHTGTLETFLLSDFSQYIHRANKLPYGNMAFFPNHPFYYEGAETPTVKFSVTLKFFWIMLMVAFFLKIPIYGLHLWLPKAHTEAPIEGSMILAAVLLKLGGYGMIRISPLIEPLTKEFCYPFIVLALWGVIMTGSTCLRQTDLKSLIAYSSVGHMGLVTAGILIQTPWGFSGAMTLMIAHGLTSSLLFCLANTNYERTHTRTMMFVRGLQVLFPLMTSWWFIAALANLALPPLPNLMGELMILVSTFNWSSISLILTGLGTLITAAYSLHMFLTAQRGVSPQYIMTMSPMYTREHLLMTLHLLPLFMLIFKPSLILGLM